MLRMLDSHTENRTIESEGKVAMQEAKIIQLVEPILVEHGLELDRLAITPMGKRKVLKITVDGDGPKGRGPLLDDISAASAALSSALDGSDAVGQAPYTLEVSSRGVSAPLEEAKHFRRNTGRLVKFTLAEEEVTGRVKGVTQDSVTIDADGTERDLALADISKAVVQVEMTKNKKGEDA